MEITDEKHRTLLQQVVTNLDIPLWYIAPITQLLLATGAEMGTTQRQDRSKDMPQLNSLKPIGMRQHGGN